MPTYEYKCLCCRHEFEATQSIKDAVGVTCPACLIWCVNRLVSGGTSFLLKGGGWAADNYGSAKTTPE